MVPLSRRERAALCDLLDHVGSAAPTLCAGWTSFELVAHLVLREAAPLSAAGVVVPRLEGFTARAMRRLQRRHGFTALVERLRSGPPRWSPMRAVRVDQRVNAMELFVHHEDLRRAQPTWEPRELTAADEDVLWTRLGSTGRLLARRSPTGLELVRSDRAGVARVKPGEPTLVVRGRPGELALFVHGRAAVAQVEYDGDPAARAHPFVTG
ncbi:MAG: TIGR03085 family metal-binding protein [Actinomycetota bacterium]|nr:TIGR03085 family metal-binding protein [Actinomycetota bacterium]